MKKFLNACAALFGCYLIHKAGYYSGWFDGTSEVMKENNIKKHTKVFKNGTTVTITPKQNN